MQLACKAGSKLKRLIACTDHRMISVAAEAASGRIQLLSWQDVQQTWSLHPGVGAWQPPHVMEKQPVKSELRQPATVPSVQPHHGGLDCCERIRDKNETRKAWGGRNETIPVYRWFVRKGDPKN